MIFQEIQKHSTDSNGRLPEVSYCIVKALEKVAIDSLSTQSQNDRPPTLSQRSSQGPAFTLRPTQHDTRSRAATSNQDHQPHSGSHLPGARAYEVVSSPSQQSAADKPGKVPTRDCMLKPMSTLKSPVHACNTTVNKVDMFGGTQPKYATQTPGGEQCTSKKWSVQEAKHLSGEEERRATQPEGDLMLFDNDVSHHQQLLPHLQQLFSHLQQQLLHLREAQLVLL